MSPEALALLPEVAAPSRGQVIARAALGLVAAVTLGAAAWWAYDIANRQPIRTVLFAGDVARIAPADLERFAASLKGLPSDGATLPAVREAARRMPWVRDASVRRRFPDAVEVSFEGYRAMARWGDALVSPQGEVFAGDTAERLPRLTGPEGSAPEMVRQFPAIVAALAPLGSPVASLKLSPRGAWLAELESGLVLEIGREDITTRLARFAAAWPRIASEGAAPRYADLRYPNGFALRRPEMAAERSAKPARQPAKRA